MVLARYAMVTGGLFNNGTNVSTIVGGNNLEPTSGSVDEDSSGFGAPPVSELVILVSVNLLCLLAANVKSQMKGYRWLPDQGLTILIGLVFGAIADGFGGVKMTGTIRSNFSGMFFEFFLPPIIFSSAYSLKKVQFIKNLGTILCFAVLGTFVSTFIIGFLLNTMVTSDVLGDSALRRELGMSECLVLGALLSAVDPVATISVLRSLRVDTQLRMLLLGESVLNDAVAIVLYNSLLYLRQSGGSLFTFDSLRQLVGHFIWVSFSSVLLGTGVGLASALTFRYARRGDYINSSREQAIMLLFAYMSYLLARMASLSPVMCLFLTGVCMSHYTFYNLSTESQIGTSSAFRSIAQVAETFVFVFLGFSVPTLKGSKWNFQLVTALVLLCIASRFVQVFSISGISNILRWLGGHQTISFNSQVMLSWAGLRGAVAFALALHAPVLSEHGAIITATMSIILFTVFVQGCSSRWLAQRLNLTDKNALKHGYDLVPQTDTHPNFQFNSPGKQKNEDGVLAPGSVPYNSNDPNKPERFHKSLWRHVDDTYLKPIFGGRIHMRSEKDVEINGAEESTPIRNLGNDYGAFSNLETQNNQPFNVEI